MLGYMQSKNFQLHRGWKRIRSTATFPFMKQQGFEDISRALRPYWFINSLHEMICMLKKQVVKQAHMQENRYIHECEVSWTKENYFKIGNDWIL